MRSQAPPYFTLDLVDQHLKEEERNYAIFEAEFSIPDPRKIRWFKNKVEIFHGDNYHIVHKEEFHSLTIKKLSVKDAGKYTLTCDGIKSSAWLHVQGEPSNEVTRSVPYYSIHPS